MLGALPPSYSRSSIGLPYHFSHYMVRDMVGEQYFLYFKLNKKKKKIGDMQKWCFIFRPKYSLSSTVVVLGRTENSLLENTYGTS